MATDPDHGERERTSDRSSSSSKAKARDLTGKTLGDFRVQRLIGRGGMGEVYLAEQISLKRPVALKVLLPEWVSRPSYLDRFAVEATAVAKLNHANIVQIYALGEAEGIHYIAMEYVEGTNLREYLIKKGSLDIPLALSIMRQSASAIGAAGEMGLIHRDVKPENLLLTRKGRIKVADFGLCRDMEADRQHVTQQGTTMGTPLYMSPEQAQGHALDPRSDLYSLGVTYYHMLVGEPPFRADSALALALKHVREQPIPIRSRRPDIPPELDHLVMKLMAKKADDRYQSAAEMLADLTRLRTILTTIVGATAVDLTSMSASASFVDAPVVGSGVGMSSRSAAATATSGSGGISRSRSVVDLWRVASVGSASWFRLRTWIVLGLCGAVAGGFLGWRRVSDERTAERARLAAAPPALGIGVLWTSTPRQESPEAQYRYAQLIAPPGELAAAWLAVPGYHPRSYDWASAAYLQLGRILYRERDADYVRRLAQDVHAWKARRTRDEQLGDVLEAAGDVLRRDVDGAIGRLQGIADSRERPLSDPGLIDFCVELVVDAIHATNLPGATGAAAQRPALTSLRGRLLLLRNKVLTTDLAVR